MERPPRRKRPDGIFHFMINRSTVQSPMPGPDKLSARACCQSIFPR